MSNSRRSRAQLQLDIESLKRDQVKLLCILTTYGLTIQRLGHDNVSLSTYFTESPGVTRILPDGSSVNGPSVPMSSLPPISLDLLYHASLGTTPLRPLVYA